MSGPTMPNQYDRQTIRISFVSFLVSDKRNIFVTHLSFFRLYENDTIYQNQIEGETEAPSI